MQKLLKKLAILAGAGALMLPISAQAQEPAESQEASDSAAENVQSETPPAPSADSQNSEETATTAAEAAPEPVETKPRNIPGNVISSSKSKKPCAICRTLIRWMP